VPASNSALTLQIKGIEDPQLRCDLEAVCKNVMSIYETKITKVPPLGVKPILLKPAPDDVPRCCTDAQFLSGQYPINLTCLNANRYYDQIVYQFAHELCHVYMSPHDLDRVTQFILRQNQSDKRIPWNNCFAEAICIAMSYICLSRMTLKWSRQPPFPNWRSYAQKFAKYRQNNINEALSQMNIPSMDKAAGWVQSELPTLVNECNDEIDKPKQKVCAIVIEQTLLAHPNAWGALCMLGDCIDYRNTNFDDWYKLIAVKVQGKLVNALAKTFDPEKQIHESP
jgi:hypothetical protein